MKQEAAVFKRWRFTAATKESYLKEAKQYNLLSSNRRTWVSKLSKLVGLYSLKYLEAEDASELEEYQKIKDYMRSNNFRQYYPINIGNKQ